MAKSDVAKAPLVSEGEWTIEELRATIQDGIDSGDAGRLDIEEVIGEAKRRKAASGTTA